MTAEFSIAVADADRYRITLAGVALSRGAGQDGYADGEYLTASNDEWFGLEEGSDGSIARSKLNGSSGYITLSLLSTSPSNAFLLQLFATDENLDSGAGVGSFVLQDIDGSTLIICRRTWIVKPPDVDLDVSAGDRVWHFQGLWSDWNVGGN